MPQQWKVHTPTQETVTPLAVNQDDYMRAVTGGDTAASRNARRYSPAARRSALRSVPRDAGRPERGEEPAQGNRLCRAEGGDPQPDQQHHRPVRRGDL